MCESMCACVRASARAGLTDCTVAELERMTDYTQIDELPPLPEKAPVTNKLAYKAKRVSVVVYNHFSDTRVRSQ